MSIETDQLVVCNECFDKGWIFWAPTNQPGVYMRLSPMDVHTKSVYVPANVLTLEPCACPAGQAQYSITDKNPNP